MFLASIILPATFSGPVFLITGWVLMGLVGMALVMSADPVKRPLLAALSRELAAVQTPIEASPAQAKGNLRVAALEVRGELQSVRTTLATLRTLPLYEGIGSPLPAHEWSRHREMLGREMRTADYEAVLLAYGLANQMNSMASQALKTSAANALAARAVETANRLDKQIDNASKRLEAYAD